MLLFELRNWVYGRSKTTARRRYAYSILVRCKNVGFVEV